MDSHPSRQKISPSWIFLVGFILALVIAISPDYLVSTSVHVVVPVYLEYAPGEALMVQLRVADLLEVVMLGPGVGTVFFVLLRKLLRVEAKAGSLARGYRFVLETCGVVLAAVNSMGNAIHLFFNAVNAIDASGGLGPGVYNGIDVSGFFLLIWFLDEWVGHALVMVTYFGYFAVASVAEFLAGNPTSDRRAGTVLSVVFGGCIAFLDGYVAILSESGFLLLLLHGAFFAIVLGATTQKRIPLRRSPILLAMLIASMLIVVINITWVVLYGWNSFYPFYSANIQNI